jgi:hypothetical protein
MMFDPFRRWLKRGNDLPGWTGLSAWARANRWTLRQTIAHDGWVMVQAGRPDWRIEWGPSQRSFMSAHELRVRIDRPQIVVAQALVVDRALLARMDREVYQQFTDSVQTRYDDQLPEEMRWLAMHARPGASELGPLRERYGVLGHETSWVLQWLEGDLAEALKRRAARVSAERADAEPLLIRLARGKLVLRQASENPDADALQTLMDVAGAADAASRRMPDAAA